MSNNPADIVRVDYIRRDGAVGMSFVVRGDALALVRPKPPAPQPAPEPPPLNERAVAACQAAESGTAGDLIAEPPPPEEALPAGAEGDEQRQRLHEARQRCFAAMLARRIDVKSDTGRQEATILMSAATGRDCPDIRQRGLTVEEWHSVAGYVEDRNRVDANRKPLEQLRAETVGVAA